MSTDLLQSTLQGYCEKSSECSLIISAYDPISGLAPEWCWDMYETRWKGKFVLFNDTSWAHWFSYHHLLDVKQMVIVTYFFRGKLLSPYRLLNPINSKGSFIRQDSTYHSLWWTSCGPLVGMENSPNYKCIHHVGSIHHAGRSKPLQMSILPPELRTIPPDPDKMP